MTLNLKTFTVTLLFTFLTTSSGYATNRKTFNWTPVINAIIEVESEGNPNAVSGASCGAMQITPILVKECNTILEKRGSKKRYTLRDRFSVQKSKEMFLLMQSHFNPENNVEKAIRAWNGGNRYKIKSTNAYYRKVMKAMNRQWPSPKDTIDLIKHKKIASYNPFRQNGAIFALYIYTLSGGLPASNISTCTPHVPPGW